MTAARKAGTPTQAGCVRGAVDPSSLCVSVAELAATPDGRDADAAHDATLYEEATQIAGLAPAGDRLLPQGCARFVSPGMGGWGIARGALCIPESVLLFVAPQACARHGIVASVLNGNRNRIFFLGTSETDLVMGTHVDRIQEMVGRILAALPEQPRAFLILATCVDDLLGSDIHGICRTLSKKYGIPFSDFHMDPITKTSSTPPAISLQRSIFRLLSDEGPLPDPNGRPQLEPDAANLIGGFVPVDADSELYDVLRAAGLTTLRQLSTCATYDDFLAMRLSGRNILLKPFAGLACRDMERRLGIPWHPVKQHLLPELVAAQYDALGSELGTRLGYEDARARAFAELDAARPWISQLSVAVGSNLNGSSFEVAALLRRLGAHVSFVIADQVAPSERTALEELAAHDPELRVYPATHPALSLVGKLDERADVAIGFDAAKLCPEAHLMLLDADTQPFGFQCATSLIRDLHAALDHPLSAKELLYKKGMVV